MKLNGLPGRSYYDIELPGKSVDNFIATTIERKTAANKKTPYVQNNLSNFNHNNYVQFEC